MNKKQKVLNCVLAFALVLLGSYGKFVASVVDEYDSKPAEDTDKNSLFLTAGLSVGF